MKKNKIDINDIQLTNLLPSTGKHKQPEVKPFMDQHYSSDDKWFLNYVKNLKLKPKQ